MLSAMTPEEIAEAKSEAEARLPALAAEFLRRRGLEKQEKKKTKASPRTSPRASRPSRRS